MHNSREKQLRSCASAHHAPKHVDAPTISPKSPARVLLRLRAVLLLPIYHRQTRACDGWQTHYYTLSVIQNAQRNRTPHEKQARIWRTAVRKPPIAPIEPSTWPALAIRYCRPMIRSLGYLVGGKVGIDRPGITCIHSRPRKRAPDGPVNGVPLAVGAPMCVGSHRMQARSIAEANKRLATPQG